MISIITAIRNQLAMNKLYLEYLRRYTHTPFELIVIDNQSDDGSREFFEAQDEVTVIANDGNYSYPYCQNQGIAAASGEVYAFFNNDIIVSPEWDLRMLKIMKEKDLDVVSMTTNDRQESASLTKKRLRRWKRIKYPVLFLFGASKFGLTLSHRLMYGNWEKFTEKRYQEFGSDILEAFSGSSVVCTKKGIEKVGEWDERIVAGDFDLYLRSKVRSIEQGDVKPMQVLLGVFFHHYQRLTLKRSYQPFSDRDKLISLRDKWGQDRIDELLKGVDV